jgi:hypothetical protein
MGLLRCDTFDSCCDTHASAAAVRTNSKRVHEIQNKVDPNELATDMAREILALKLYTTICDDDEDAGCWWQLSLY